MKAAGLGGLLAATGATVAEATPTEATPTEATPTEATPTEATPTEATPAGRTVITRELPGTDERVPALGMGTFMTFDKRPGADRSALREVLRRFRDGGGRVVDTSPLYGLSEATVGDLAAGLGLTDELFLTDKTWATGEYLGDFSHARRQLSQSKTRLWRDRIDVLQVHSLVAVETNLPILQHFKQEKQIRYLGISHHDPLYFPLIEWWIQNGELDVIQIHYSIQTRVAEQRLLRLAADRGIAVLVNMPLEKARLHKLVEGRRLPRFAAEIGCENWAQFFLKYVISHPAVTCALPATTNPEHMRENLGAMRGELPDEKFRRQMVRYMERIPGFAELQEMPWYPDKTFDGIVTIPPVPPVK